MKHSKRSTREINHQTIESRTYILHASSLAEIHIGIEEGCSFFPKALPKMAMIFKNPGRRNDQQANLKQQTSKSTQTRKFILKSWDRPLVQSRSRDIVDVFAAARREEKFSPGNASNAGHVYANISVDVEDRALFLKLQVAMVRHTNDKRSTGCTYISRIIHSTYHPVENLLRTAKQMGWTKCQFTTPHRVTHHL